MVKGRPVCFLRSQPHLHLLSILGLPLQKGTLRYLVIIKTSSRLNSWQSCQEETGLEEHMNVDNLEMREKSKKRRREKVMFC